jgi:hypothetical protein
METRSEEVPESGKITMGRRIPIIVNGRREMLWEEVGQSIEEQDGAADNFQNPTTNLPMETIMSVAQYQPTSEEEQHRAAERDYWKRQLRLAKWMNWVTGVASVAGIIGLAFIYGTLKATQDQTQAAIDALHSQRPYMSLGKADGVIAKYQPPVGEREKGTIELYFLNTGTAPATRFLVNAFSSLPTAEKIQERHLYRAKRFRDGKFIGWALMGGNTVGRDATRIEVLDAKSVPSPDEWRQVEDRKLDFSIRGNFEYCDLWGKYTCEVFMLTYRPSDGGSFTIDASLPCPPSMIAKPDLQGKDPSVYVEMLSECQQPQERTSGKELVP